MCGDVVSIGGFWWKMYIFISNVLWRQYVCCYYVFYVSVVHNMVYKNKLSFSWPNSFYLGLALVLCIEGCM